MSENQATLTALIADLTRLEGTREHAIYAVLDGAKFENLPALLLGEGFASRSLHRGPSAPVAPWLVDPYEPLASIELGDGDEDPEAAAERMANEMKLALEVGDPTGFDEAIVARLTRLAELACAAAAGRLLDRAQKCRGRDRPPTDARDRRGTAARSARRHEPRPVPPPGYRRAERGSARARPRAARRLLRAGRRRHRARAFGASLRSP